jgi:hypothetical protein
MGYTDIDIDDENNKTDFGIVITKVNKFREKTYTRTFAIKKSQEIGKT